MVAIRFDVLFVITVELQLRVGHRGLIQKICGFKVFGISTIINNINNQLSTTLSTSSSTPTPHYQRHYQRGISKIIKREGGTRSTFRVVDAHPLSFFLSTLSGFWELLSLLLSTFGGSFNQDQTTHELLLSFPFTTSYQPLLLCSNSPTLLCDSLRNPI